jgi:hypothetical protein
VLRGIACGTNPVIDAASSQRGEAQWAAGTARAVPMAPITPSSATVRSGGSPCVCIAAHPARADDVLTELHELGGAREGRNKALVIFRPVASDSGGQQPAQRSS